jgi:hypothetical protein
LFPVNDLTDPSDRLALVWLVRERSLSTLGKFVDGGPLVSLVLALPALTLLVACLLMVEGIFTIVAAPSYR